MSDNEKKDLFFPFESNQEESETSRQDKNSIVLIEEAENKNFDDKKKRKKREKDEQEFNDLEENEDGDEFNNYMDTS